MRNGTSRLFLLGLVLLVFVTAGCQQAPPRPDPDLFRTPEGPYDYQWEDPLVATVVTTPPHQRAPLPEAVPTEERRVRIDAGPPVPPALWYQDGLRYALAAQPGRAPLVFVVAGTGASATSRTSSTFARVLYAGGFHVLTLPSPTHPDFIVNASSTGVPGRLAVDARDLYRAMQAAYEDVRDEIEIDGVRLAGYSLGGWHAAFVAYLDAQRGDFGFEQVLLVNPPVSLYRSMTILDAMLVDNIDGGIEGLPAFVDRVLSRISEIYVRSDRPGDFAGDFLYKAYLLLQPKDRDLAALIGLVFRLTALDVAMTADLMSEEGYIVPASAQPGWTTPLSPYWAKGVRRGFNDYLDNLLYPYYRHQEPGLTRATLVEEATLDRIEGFLASTPSIHLVTNADDIIYAPGDLAFLERVFGARATVFPRGGHCGNFEHPHVVAAMHDALAGRNAR